VGNLNNVKYLLTLPEIDPIFGECYSYRRADGRTRSPIFNAIYSGKTDIVLEMLKNEKVIKEYEDTIKVFCNILQQKY